MSYGNDPHSHQYDKGYGNQQSYAQATTWDEHGMMASMASEDERTAFIRRTYLHLLGAVIAFVAIETVLFTVIPQATLESALINTLGRSPYAWLVVLGAYMVVGWIARSWASSSTSIGVQYAGLSLYVVGKAIIFVPLLFAAVYYTNEPSLLPAAAALSLFIFGGLTFATFITKHDFSFMGRFLWFGGIAAMGVIFCGIFFQFQLGFWFSAAMIVLASGYILYDTSNIIHHYRTNQHVAASLALFSSVAVLFYYVLQIMMSRR